MSVASSVSSSRNGPPNLLCSKCFSSEGQEKQLYLISCLCILCNNCVKKTKEASKCVTCSVPPKGRGFLAINDSMPSEYKVMLKSKKEALVTFQSKVRTVEDIWRKIDITLQTVKVLKQFSEKMNKELQDFSRERKEMGEKYNSLKREFSMMSEEHDKLKKLRNHDQERMQEMQKKYHDVKVELEKMKKSKKLSQGSKTSTPFNSSVTPVACGPADQKTSTRIGPDSAEGKNVFLPCFPSKKTPHGSTSRSSGNPFDDMIDVSPIPCPPNHYRPPLSSNRTPPRDTRVTPHFFPSHERKFRPFS